MAELGEEERVGCRTPNPGKSGVVRIPRWKFEAVRTAILDELAEGDVRFADLTGRVKERLDPALRNRLGSVGWHVATVKLELEVRGEIRRVQARGGQRLERTP